MSQVSKLLPLMLVVSNGNIKIKNHNVILSVIGVFNKSKKPNMQKMLP